jgi:hypothetical protein
LPKRSVSPSKNLSINTRAHCGQLLELRKLILLLAQPKSLTKIPELANKYGSITHFRIGPSGVERTAPGAPIFATPLKNSDAGNSIQTRSRTTSHTTAASIKPSKYRSGSDSKETQLKDESDFDEYDEDVSNFFQTPSMVNKSDKTRLRAIAPKHYAVGGEEELGDIGSDDNGLNPNVGGEKEKRKAYRRRGTVVESSDDC